MANEGGDFMMREGIIKLSMRIMYTIIHHEAIRYHSNASGITSKIAFHFKFTLLAIV